MSEQLDKEFEEWYERGKSYGHNKLHLLALEFIEIGGRNVAGTVNSSFSNREGIEYAHIEYDMLSDFKDFAYSEWANMKLLQSLLGPASSELL